MQTRCFPCLPLEATAQDILQMSRSSPQPIVAVSELASQHTPRWRRMSTSTTNNTCRHHMVFLYLLRHMCCLPCLRQCMEGSISTCRKPPCLAMRLAVLRIQTQATLELLQRATTNLWLWPVAECPRHTSREPSSGSSLLSIHTHIHRPATISGSAAERSVVSERPGRRFCSVRIKNQSPHLLLYIHSSHVCCLRTGIADAACRVDDAASISKNPGAKTF